MTAALSFRRSLCLLTVVAVPLILGALAGRSVAAPDDEAENEARKRFRRGTKLFDDGKFREAAHEFESGYAVLPRTGFLLNIGHSYRRAGDLKKAKRYYELFLQQETESPRQRAEAAEYIKIVDEGLAEQASDDLPDNGPAVKERLSPRPGPTQPNSALVMSNTDLEKLCRTQSEKTVWIPWVIAGVAALAAAGLGAALIITNR
jgi:tetratricopeptide (TPR) repeat protein